MAYDPPLDANTPSGAMPVQPQRSPFPTPPPMTVGNEAIVVHLSYLVAQMSALVPKVDTLHDASVRRDSEIRALRTDVRRMSDTLEDHAGLHINHSRHLGEHCEEIADLNKVVAAGDEPKSWVGKLGAKAVDALIPMIITIIFFGALAGWTGVRLQWGAQAQPDSAKDAGKPAAQGAHE